MLPIILPIVFPVFAIVAIGFLYARKRPPDMDAANRLNLDIFTPALLLSVLSGRDVDLQSHWWLRKTR